MAVEKVGVYRKMVGRGAKRWTKGTQFQSLCGRGRRLIVGLSDGTHLTKEQGMARSSRRERRQEDTPQSSRSKWLWERADRPHKVTLHE